MFGYEDELQIEIELLKEQLSKMYSAEEVIVLLTKMNYWSTLNTGKDEVINWFEQFKKK